MWDTTEEINPKTKKLTRLVVVPYTNVQWISKGGQTPNELRVWLEELVRNDTDCH